MKQIPQPIVHGQRAHQGRGQAQSFYPYHHPEDHQDISGQLGCWVPQRKHRATARIQVGIPKLIDGYYANTDHTTDNTNGTFNVSSLNSSLASSVEVDG